MDLNDVTNVLNHKTIHNFYPKLGSQISLTCNLTTNSSIDLFKFPIIWLKLQADEVSKGGSPIHEIQILLSDLDITGQFSLTEKLIVDGNKGLRERIVIQEMHTKSFVVGPHHHGLVISCSVRRPHIIRPFESEETFTMSDSITLKSLMVYNIPSNQLTNENEVGVACVMCTIYSQPLASVVYWVVKYDRLTIRDIKIPLHFNILMIQTLNSSIKDVTNYFETNSCYRLIGVRENIVSAEIDHYMTPEIILVAANLHGNNEFYIKLISKNFVF
ncbi:hypothetical protein HELRODRAFT_181547 [Helobdella robusta]|uniref:Uncharacterized protein n=1 Tax=Helobdella robusta TaxID=6412 RepID=T1FH34_HELRO|nr:hypothetical protein HELRODRAFT_181547 [Helobdella robusta]ESN92349.1 hypothetical protein HELRODRAFT_181547 [Helobdella robusta]